MALGTPWIPYFPGYLLLLLPNPEVGYSIVHNAAMSDRLSLDEVTSTTLL